MTKIKLTKKCKSNLSKYLKYNNKARKYHSLAFEEILEKADEDFLIHMDTWIDCETLGIIKTGQDFEDEYNNIQKEVTTND